MTYRFSELTNPDFEYCPYVRATQMEFDFGPEFRPNQPLKIKGLKFEREIAQSRVLMSEIMEYPVTEEAKTEIIIALYNIHDALVRDDLLTEADAQSVLDYLEERKSSMKINPREFRAMSHERLH